MGTAGQLRKVEGRLVKDLKQAPLTLSGLGEKYGVSRQAIFNFIRRKGIKRPRREHIRKCSICQGLVRIAKKPHSDFISSHTIEKQLGFGNLKYHIGILRKKGLVSQMFGRLRSVKAERAYQIYFKKKLPVRTIGRQVGLRNFHSIIKQHKGSGWTVPPPLFKYDSAYRLKNLRMVKKKKSR